MLPIMTLRASALSLESIEELSMIFASIQKVTTGIRNGTGDAKEDILMIGLVL